MKIKIWLVSLSVGLLACAPTQLNLVWHDSAFQGGPLRKILVIGMSDKESTRRAFESQVAKQFEAAGVAATPSAGKITLGASVSKEDVVAQIKTMDVDSVIVSRLLAVDTETEVTPPSSTSVPVGATFGSYYSSIQREVYSPGFTTEYKVFKIETNIYSVATQALVWSGTSSTTDPTSAEHLIQSVAAAIIKDIRKKGLIAK